MRAPATFAVCGAANGTLAGAGRNEVVFAVVNDVVNELGTGGIVGPVMLYAPPAGKEALLYHPGFALDNHKTYRLSFSVRSSAKGKLEFAPLSATSPWHALGSYACFPMDTAHRTITWFFKPNKSSRNARVNFKSDITFWISDVSLREITPPSDNANSIRLIYNMTTEPRDILLGGKYRDADGNLIPASVTLDAYASQILFRME